ncbi:MAG: hypothetical protein OXB93_02140 [Cytophagales bacterium]|nr:hypothetical protein [Cytophagales bacterium]
MQKLTQEEKDILITAWQLSWLSTYGFKSGKYLIWVRKWVPKHLLYILDDNDLMDKYVTDTDILEEHCHNKALSIDPEKYKKEFSNDY